MKFVFCLFIGVFYCVAASAQEKLGVSTLFSDHMVLQHNEYGLKQVASGPLYKGIKFSGSRLMVESHPSGQASKLQVTALIILRSPERIKFTCLRPLYYQEIK